MRHFLANLFLYLLTAALLAGSALWAYVRSEHFVVERAVDRIPPRPAREITTLADFDWADFGRRTYRVNCQNCHTVDGSGRGMYPPVQRMTAHLAAAGGRDYLINLNLYGLYTGAYGAPMPPIPELSDAEIAAVTNYILTAFAPEGERPDPDQLFLPREVAALRGRAFSEREVARRRPAVPTARELGRGVRPPQRTDAPAVPEGRDE